MRGGLTAEEYRLVYRQVAGGIEGRRCAMKLIPVILVAGSLILSAVPAFAAPQWVEDRCWYHANRVLPALDHREREAYIANCIADWTAGTPPPPRGRGSTDRNRY
jgi:phosphoribosylformimino-5-aminoimidazole carboxamide ribonucleotide (ProFAR) isomerase